jgi:hypothetical protein
MSASHAALLMGRAGGDPYWTSVVQLAHGNGSNGSTTITNSCPRGNTMTVRGSTTISTAQSKWGGSSIRSPNASSGASGANNADYGFGQGAATLEGWFRFDSLSSIQIAFSFMDEGPAVRISTTGQPIYFCDSSNRITGSAGVIVANTWHFISFCTAGGSTGVARNQYLHVDGTHIGTWLNAYAYGSPGTINLFYDAYGINGTGYADDFRVTKGVCRYSGANYAVPTAAFPDS